MILLHSRYLLFHKSVITLRERLMGFVFFGYPSIVAGLFSSAIILTFFKIKLQSLFLFLVFVFMCRKVKKMLVRFAKNCHIKIFDHIVRRTIIV